MSDNNERKQVFVELKKAFDANPKLKILPNKNVTPFLNHSILKAASQSEEILQVPLYSSRISAGIASPVDDHIDRYLDLNRHLIKQPNSTFLVRVEGDSMTGVGIYNHDILIVDRSVKPSDDKIVVAVIDNEFTVKRLRILDKQITLLPENPNFKPIVVTEDMDFKIWGVVLHSIRTF